MLVLPLSAELVLPAATLITHLRKETNGRDVCTAEEMAAVLEAALIDGKDSYYGFLGLRGQRPVGYIGLNKRFAIYAGGVFGQITELVSDPAHRREGVGTALVAWAGEQARRQGWRCLEVRAPRRELLPDTLAFYLKRGFNEDGPGLSLDL